MKIYTSKTAYFKILAVLVLLFVSFLATDAHALELDYPEIPTPTGPIDLNCLEIDACEISITMLLVIFYGASVWVGGIIAFLALLFTGLSYILGGNNPALRNKARQRFVDVVWGLAILLMVNAIMVVINPSILSSMEDPSILNVENTEERDFGFLGFTFYDIEENTGGGSTGGGGGGGSTCYNTCINDGNTPSECSAACSGTTTPDCAQDYQQVGSISCTGSACGGGKTISLPDSIENNDPICNQTVAQSMLAAYGWDNDEQWTCLKQLWEGESNWLADATNPSSCAYGIPQSCPGDKLESSGTDWRVNPATQVDWGLKYIQGRTDYDDPCDAYNTWKSRDPHWY